jgi:hypothetical protein
LTEGLFVFVDSGAMVQLDRQPHPRHLSITGEKSWTITSTSISTLRQNKTRWPSAIWWRKHIQICTLAASTTAP